MVQHILSPHDIIPRREIDAGIEVLSGSSTDMAQYQIMVNNPLSRILK